MSQSKKGSLIEAMVNTFIGFAITLIMAPLIYWIAGVTMSATKMSITTALFTVLSVLRNYFIRRWFNSGKLYTHKKPSHDQS